MEFLEPTTFTLFKKIWNDIGIDFVNKRSEKECHCQIFMHTKRAVLTNTMQPFKSYYSWIWFPFLVFPNCWEHTSKQFQTAVTVNRHRANHTDQPKQKRCAVHLEAGLGHILPGMPICSTWPQAQYCYLLPQREQTLLALTENSSRNRAIKIKQWSSLW